MALLSTGLGHRSDTAKARKTMDTGLVHHGVLTSPVLPVPNYTAW